MNFEGRYVQAPGEVKDAGSEISSLEARVSSLAVSENPAQTFVAYIGRGRHHEAGA